MAKSRTSSKVKPRPLTPMAERLLLAMSLRPNRVEYNIRVLPGIFRAGDTARLDEAYEELVLAGLAERAGVEISFFGEWKHLCRLTASGVARAQPEAA